MWEGETVVRRCDSSQGGVKVVRNLFQLMERCEKYRQVCHLMDNCDDHGGGEQGLGEV